MKFIARADDLGLSEAVNYGIEKACKDGIIKSLGVMSNMEYAQHGLSLIENCKGLSIGLHINFSVGKSVSSIEKIPSLVDINTGNFYTSSQIASRFSDTIVLSEAIIEVEAQLQKFFELTNKKPSYMDGHAILSMNFFEAIRRVAKHHDIFLCDPLDKNWMKEANLHLCVEKKFDTKTNMYDPLSYLLEDWEHMLDKNYVLCVFHPGYIDQFLLEHSSFTLVRPLETSVLCDVRIKQWVKQHQIQLYTFDDYKKEMNKLL